MPTYNHLNKAFILTFSDQKIGEELLCELGKSSLA